METALANAVVENTKQFQGLYVPTSLKKGTFVFFASDNIDFAEDTADGKGTKHGTVTAIYRRLMHLVNQSHPHYALVTQSQRVFWRLHTIQPCYRVRRQKQLHRRSG